MEDDLSLGYLLAVAAAGVWSPRPLTSWFASLGDARAVVDYARRRAGCGPAGAEPLGREAIERIAAVDDGRASDALAAARTCEARILTKNSNDYPARLRVLCDAPLVLYCRGDTAALGARTVAIVGSRSATPYGRSVATALCRDFARFGATIVSGLARGIDAAAHREAIQSCTPTVAVIGSGLAALYPDYHRSLAQEIVAAGGAVISEFPPALHAQAHQFPMRNRIVAALADATVIVEAGFKSGALITARLADEIGRPVFAIPGDVERPTSKGTNGLIKDGVPLAESAAEIAASLEWEAAGACDAAHGCEPGQPLLAHLDPHGSAVDELSRKTGLDAAAVSAQLTLLEISGAVRRQAGLFTAVKTQGRPNLAAHAHPPDRRR
ncbi:MAG: DNA-protecting protein DprA [Candidatus Eremiobacteraeota bacterium]|nr:DNA-protecting protein DprA [Candidatus Eremiobacteraeota bacterium]MBC5827702.1 DNA-protecting protein DprA [Candidatus Eremiobacteraeota bacterium]